MNLYNPRTSQLICPADGFREPVAEAASKNDIDAALQIHLVTDRHKHWFHTAAGP